MYLHVNTQCNLQLTDLISDIGGNMGVFAGVSLLTIAEYLELTGYLACITYKKHHWKRKLRHVRRQEPGIALN